MLTGKTRYRVGFRKRLVIQVEFWRRGRYGGQVLEYKQAWRDATIEDMQAIDHGDVTQSKPGDISRYSPPPPKRKETTNGTN